MRSGPVVAGRMTTACPVCGDEFASGTGVRDHAWDVHGVCHYCTEGFDDRTALYAHWLEVHDGDLSRDDRKRAETKVGERTVCPTCERRFGDEARVRDHAWENHGICHHCGAAFDGRETLYTHWLAAHDDALSRADRKMARSAVGPLSFGQRLTHEGATAALSGTSVDRRRFLRVGGTGAVAVTGVVAGRELVGGGSDPDGSGESLTSHPAAAGIDAQPTLGPPPGRGHGTIVAYEDPSCPSCARFERATFPGLKTRLVEGEDVSFVFRGIPVVNHWGESATEDAVLAMEATYARDPAAFWSLKSFYYRNQRDLGSADVRSETRRFLASATDVDADAVLSDVENGAQANAVLADLDAARDAGVRGTPTFFLFRDGSFVTKVIRPQSTEFFANALGV